MRVFLLLWLAAVFSTQSPAAIPVFRTLDSRYDSGEADPAQLEEEIQKIVPKVWKKIEWQKKTYWVPAEQLLAPIHFARHAYAVKKTSAYTEPNLKLPATTELQAQEPLRIVNHQSPWVEVSPEKKPKVKYWLEDSELSVRWPTDSLVYSLDKAILYEKSDVTSKVLTLLNPETELLAVGLGEEEADGWIKVHFGQLTGFVLNEQVLGIWQLANRVKSGGRWHDIEKVTPRAFKVKTAETISLSQVEDLSFNESLNLVGPLGAQLREEAKTSSPVVSEIDAGHSVRVIGVQRELWAQTTVEHIGSVWWKMEKAPQQKNITLRLTASEFFKREIFDMVRSPKVKSLVFASAGGIFRSDDGYHWQPVERFKGTDYPLAASRSGKIFIGPYASFDNGETFHPYIRWDRFLHSLQEKLPVFENVGPDKLRLVKIVPQDESGRRIQLLFEVGQHKVLALTGNGGESWTFRKVHR